MGSDGPFFGTLLWKLRQLLTRGRIYDYDLWLKHMRWFSLGMTFREAFEKTGRVLNISCTPLRSRGRRAPPLQLNHISAPHVDIASAVCASACVPMLIEPVTLLEKARYTSPLRRDTHLPFGEIHISPSSSLSLPFSNRISPDLPGSPCSRAGRRRHPAHVPRERL